MIRFNCAGCGRELQIGEALVRQLARCPFCQAVSRVSLRRTPKAVIIGRISLLPMLALGFYAFFFAHVGLATPFVLGGVGMMAFMIPWMWGFTNFMVWLTSPREYRIWKSGGGDPFFDTVDSPFNTDSPETRYQELYAEKLRQQFPPPPQVPPASDDDGLTLDSPLA
jgi:hypothetical protein